MKINIWIIILISINFSIISALLSHKVSYNKVSFIKRDDSEYEDTEDGYNEKTEYVYVTYSKIINSMSRLSKFNPETTSLIKLGKSCDLNDILALEIQKPNYNPKFSNTILLVAGVYENDWQSVFTTFYVAKKLIENKENMKMMFGINTKWLIIPILNPDLYTNTFQGNGVIQNNSECFNNSTHYVKILEKIKEKNVTTIIHLNSEKVCSLQYSNYLQHGELSINGNKKNNLATVLRKEKYLICDVNIQEPITLNNTNITTNGTFEEWIFKNVKEFHSVIVLSLTVLNSAPPQYNNLVELKTVLTTVQIIKKIKIFFSQTYFTVIDNWRNEIDNYLHRRFPHEGNYYANGAKIKVCQILLLLQLFVLYMMNKIKL